MKRIFCLLIWCILCTGVLAANADYQLAPQDKIGVTVTHHAELSGSYTIPSEGIIDFPRAGRLNVKGLTVTQAAVTIKNALSAVLRDPEVSVVLEQMHPLNVSVLGRISHPGRYTLIEGSRVTELLADAGDLMGERSILTADLVRGTTHLPVDLSAVLSGKDANANVLLQDGDILIIRMPSNITVRVIGQVRNPGIYHLLENSMLLDALMAAGDTAERPDHLALSLVRGEKTEKVRWGDNTRILQDGDLIVVDREKMIRVYINGQVNHAGVFDLPDGGGILEAIALAGGVQDNAAMSQVTIIRHNGPSEHVNLVPALVHGDVTQNPRLGPDDLIIVPAIRDRIVVLGMVNLPGTYMLSDAHPATVLDAISLAGGQNKRAKLSQVAVIRAVNGKYQRIPVNVLDVINKGNSTPNITLVADDIVFVPETNSPRWDELLADLNRASSVATTKVNNR